VATSGDVIATLVECDEWTDAVPYTFTGDGSYTFIYHDLAGNESSATAEVHWIDKTPPHGWLTYSPPALSLTNQDVIVTLFTDEPLQTPIGWTFVDSTTFTRVFTDNT
jgi:hypothetical protein